MSPLSVDEFADFAVAIPDRDEAAADVGLDGAAARQQQEAAGERDRHLRSFSSCPISTCRGVSQVGVDAGHGSLRVGEADARFEARAEAEEVLAADGHAVEVLDLEQQRMLAQQVR